MNAEPALDGPDFDQAATRIWPAAIPAGGFADERSASDATLREALVAFAATVSVLAIVISAWALVVNF